MPRPYPYSSHSSEAFTGRLLRSLENPLRLLHRSNSDFFILGATGNVYTVSLTTNPTCTCPDIAIPCKHILFVYIRVLSLPVDDSCLQKRTLDPYKVTRLLAVWSAIESLADEATRRRFLEICEKKKDEKLCVTVKEGSTCPVCLEDMGGGGGGGGRVLACDMCKNPIHEECWMTWKRKGKRTCVICRATWRGMDDEKGYINLSAHVRRHDDVAYVNEDMAHDSEEEEEDDDDMAHDSEEEEEDDDDDDDMVYVSEDDDEVDDNVVYISEDDD